MVPEEPEFTQGAAHQVGAVRDRRQGEHQKFLACLDRVFGDTAVQGEHRRHGDVGEFRHVVAFQHRAGVEIGCELRQLIAQGLFVKVFEVSKHGLAVSIGGIGHRKRERPVVAERGLKARGMAFVVRPGLLGQAKRIRAVGEHKGVSALQRPGQHFEGQQVAFRRRERVLRRKVYG